jgi:putative IMPACT (imprinted ancient) family translation regulator
MSAWAKRYRLSYACLFARVVISGEPTGSSLFRPSGATTKGWRRHSPAVTAIKESGPDSVSVVLQGKLEAGDILTDAGIAATPRVPKAAATAA